MVWVCGYFRTSFSQQADLALLQLIAAAEDAGVEVQGAYTGGVESMGGSYGGGGAGRISQGRMSGMDSLDYEEFRQPDANGDHVISRLEVRCVGDISRL